MRLLFGLLLCVVVMSAALALNNGLALTPPMGWLAWTRFTCQVDCHRYPNECISEDLFMSMANLLVTDGYLEAGYNRVNVDDCWEMKHRSADNELIADPTRFRHGMKWLAQYMHQRGLLLGMYSNYGQYTCMGYPGTQIKDMQNDAKVLASWDVDMLKFDGCFNDPEKLDEGYMLMGAALNKSGRNMVYSCSWPFYMLQAHKKPDYSKIQQHCNMWRNFHDIQISWGSILYIIDFYDRNQEELAQFHGPGHWNDPDMIIIGNPGLTVDQCKVQMALWSIWSAPLLMSNDLRDIGEEFKRILLNKRVIAIDQDPLGIMGKKVKQKDNVAIYVKPMTPKDGDEYSYAIAFFNRDNTVHVRGFTGILSDLKLNNEKGYWMQELFTGKHINRVVLPSWEYSVDIPPTGVVIYKATLAQFEDYIPSDDSASDIESAYNTKIYMYYFFATFAVVILFVKYNKRYCRSLRRTLGL